MYFDTSCVSSSSGRWSTLGPRELGVAVNYRDDKPGQEGGGGGGGGGGRKLAYSK